MSFEYQTFLKESEILLSWDSGLFALQEDLAAAACWRLSAQRRASLRLYFFCSLKSALRKEAFVH